MNTGTKSKGKKTTTKSNRIAWDCFNKKQKKNNNKNDNLKILKRYIKKGKSF